ncbi:MAG: hypothetical protein JWM32_1585 [Verrucomicrobia bacterium]|nr:hypothetical protein [Verrucomicrobiota bacterium]
MKRLFLFLILSARAVAQFIVNDPINTTVSIAIQSSQVANHAAVLAKWAQQLEQLNRQLRQLEAQLDVQQRIKSVIGDPVAAGANLLARNLGLAELVRSYGQTLGEARQLASAIDSLKRTSEGIYHELDDVTSLKRSFVREEALYLRYAAVEKLADNFAGVAAATSSRAESLQAEIAGTLEALRGAGTQAEVDKLTAKLSALNGQVAHLDQQRRDEADKLRSQQILNENQEAKERQDLLEKQFTEERESFGVAGQWQEAIALIPTDYSKK